MDEASFGKLCLGAVTGGALVFGGYLIHRYAIQKYPQHTPSFTDFETLRRHLTNSPSSSNSGSVAVEGTVEKLDQNVLWSEKAGAEGAARRVVTVYGRKSSKAKTNMNISVPFRLVDVHGRSLRVVSVHKAERLYDVMQKVWEENAKSENSPVTSEYLLTYGVQIGAYGLAELQSDEVTFTPTEVDTSTEDLLRYRKMIKLFYELSSVGFLALGGFVWVITLASVQSSM